VGNIPGRFLGARFQLRIDGKSHLRHFIDRRRNSGSFAEAISGSESLQFVGIHRIHHVVKQLAQLGIAVGVIAAFQHPVDGVVKILARGFEVPGFEILLAGSKFLLHLLDEVVPSGWNRRQQPDVIAEGRILHRQQRQFHGSL